jgi:hypothetical protein
VEPVVGGRRHARGHTKRMGSKQVVAVVVVVVVVAVVVVVMVVGGGVVKPTPGLDEKRTTGSRI